MSRRPRRARPRREVALTIPAAVGLAILGTFTPGPLPLTVAPTSALGHALSIGLSYVRDCLGGTAKAAPIAGSEVPELLGRWADGLANAAFASGDRLYQGRGPRLLIFDASVPAAPTFLGEITLPSLITDIEVVGGLAFVAADRSGLRVIDLSHEVAPVEVGSFNPGTAVSDLEVVGDTVYLTDGGGFWIVDASGPSTPEPLHFEATPGVARGIDVVSGRAYIADSFGDVRIYQLDDPNPPTLLGVFGAGSGLYEKIAVVGNLAWVAEWTGLRALDVTNPASPTQVGSFDSMGNICFDVSVVGDFAYVATRGARGLRVLDVSNPAQPTEVGFIAESSHDGASRVFYEGCGTRNWADPA